MSGLLVARRGSLQPARAVAAGDAYGTAVAADNPTAWWRMEETSGSTVADEVGSNNGTVFGANLNVASFADTGSAASFDGTDDYVSTPHNSVLNAGDLFTFECLVQVDAPSADALQMIADKTAASAGNGQYGLWWENRSVVGSPLRIRFMCGNNSVAGRRAADYDGTAARDALLAGAHVVGTYDRTASVSVRLYVNGSEVAVSASGTGNTINTSNTLALGFGDFSTNAGFYLDGIMDEVALYDKVLTPARILAHAQAAGLA